LPATLFFFLLRPPPRSPLFPYPTLFRSAVEHRAGAARVDHVDRERLLAHQLVAVQADRAGVAEGDDDGAGAEPLDLGQARLEVVDRKSTRLNSSHVKISYAVFCLKKKKK